jgi:hypothetical protein
MGWKASMIIIENKNNFSDEEAILKALGKDDFVFSKETTLEECIHPGDNSINIGYYNGNIIICDDYQITESLEKAKNLDLTKEEKELVKLFPNSEIIMAACHSTVNYHGYSLIQNGKKTRLKTISSDEPVKEFGQRTPEEENIYKNSITKEGQHSWEDEHDPDYEYTEDQLMEKFTFGFAKRRLGVLIDHDEGDELQFHTSFKKFIRSQQKIETKATTNISQKKSYKWLPYVLIILALIVWQILKRTIWKN